MLRLNNWMQYQFDNGVVNGPKLNKYSEFKLIFSTGYKPKNLTYHQALFYNASVMADNFNQPFDVLLSGGIDSEIVVRVFHKLGIKQNVYCIKLENEYNIRDVLSAIDICKNLDINLTIIDWNLKKWIEHDAYTVYQQTFSPTIERMVRFAWFDFFDNVIVLGEGEPYWKRDISPDYTKPNERTKKIDYSIKSDWHLLWSEDDFMNSIYANLKKQTIIGEWYNYTPEIVTSYHKLPLIKKLLNDELLYKTSCWSSRLDIHKVVFPGLILKTKLAGYEGANGTTFTRPDFLTAFQKEVIGDTSNKIYKFSAKDLDSLFI